MFGNPSSRIDGHDTASVQDAKECENMPTERQVPSRQTLNALQAAQLEESIDKEKR